MIGFDDLAAAERELPHLLRSLEGWNSLDVNYHPPRVERLWRPWGDGLRLFLHCIHPCKPEEALLHPHLWPSVMRVRGHGWYHMLVGSSPGLEVPPVVVETRVSVGNFGSYTYAMLHPDGWHAVVPHQSEAYSVMLTGTPWQRPTPQVTTEAAGKLGPLPLSRQHQLLQTFRDFYPS